MLGIDEDRNETATDATTLKYRDRRRDIAKIERKEAISVIDRFGKYAEPPYALLVLNDLLDEKPFSYFTTVELDDVAAERNLEKHGSAADMSSTGSDLANGLWWWTSVSLAFQTSTFLEVKDGPFSPALSTARDEMQKALESFLAEYPSVFLAFAIFSPEHTKQILKVVRLYRLFTRSVCKYARVVCPTVDLRCLEEQV